MRAPMKRREVLAALAGALGFPLSSHAQHASEPVRLGYIWIGTRGSDDQTIAGIRQGLSDVGLLEGRHFVLEERYAEGAPDRVPALAQELARLQVAAILVPGSVATQGVRLATTTLPIISASGDPVEAGFAQSLARPGGNVTGMAVTAGDRLVEKWLEFVTL